MRFQIFLQFIDMSLFLSGIQTSRYSSNLYFSYLQRDLRIFREYETFCGGHRYFI